MSGSYSSINRRLSSRGSTSHIPHRAKHHLPFSFLMNISSTIAPFQFVNSPQMRYAARPSFRTIGHERRHIALAPSLIDPAPDRPKPHLLLLVCIPIPMHEKLRDV